MIAVEKQNLLVCLDSLSKLAFLLVAEGLFKEDRRCILFVLRIRQTYFFLL